MCIGTLYLQSKLAQYSHRAGLALSIVNNQSDRVFADPALIYKT